MKSVRNLLILALGIWFALGIAVAQAADAAKPGLFVNLTSVDPHRVEMALNFAEAAAKRGNTVTVFLNIESSRIAVKDDPKYAPSRANLEDAMKAGVKVIACPMCMKHVGVKEADLVSGVQMGNPDLTQGALFAPDTRTMSW